MLCRSFQLEEEVLMHRYLIALIVVGDVLIVGWTLTQHFTDAQVARGLAIALICYIAATVAVVHWAIVRKPRWIEAVRCVCPSHWSVKFLCGCLLFTGGIMALVPWIEAIR